MEIVLIRHAVAFDHDPLQWPDDHDRPLTPEGARRFGQVAKGLARVVGEVDALLSSPWARAWRTAEIAARKARWPKPVPYEWLEGDRSAAEVLENLGEYGGLGRIALIGHEPQLRGLAAYLLLGDDQVGAFALKKGGAALIEFDQAPRAGGGRLDWLLTQKHLRRLK